jgi:hypothetical protein
MPFFVKLCSLRALVPKKLFPKEKKNLSHTKPPRVEFSQSTRLFETLCAYCLGAKKHFSEGKGEYCLTQSFTKKRRATKD